jgi:hypothetical protein
MLIGVYIPGTLQTSGGAYSYISRTVDAIQNWEKSQSDIKILFLYSSGRDITFLENGASFKNVTIQNDRVHKLERRLVRKIR